MSPAGLTFLITGGASGLGAACARRLVQAGASVVIADVSAAAGEALAKELGERAACVLGAARIVGRDGPHDLALFERVIRVNLVGTFNMLRLAAAAMTLNPPGVDGERGVIVNTASVAAFDGQIGQAAYAASKGGVASLTLPAARELARFGIRVVAIAPGVFDTAMMQAAPDAVRQSLAEQAAFPHRFGRPEEFAQLVQQVIENPMLNGCVIRLDGAMRMGPK
jgi:NAD(P)-dependent dehydrogenase (short-subunit alcohol dehydrogenase family)